MHNSVVDRIAGWWCKRMHNEPMWPVNGKYICRTCLRAHPVEWSNSHSYATRPVPALHPVPASPVLRRLQAVKAES